MLDVRISGVDLPHPAHTGTLAPPSCETSCPSPGPSCQPACRSRRAAKPVPGATRRSERIARGSLRSTIAGAQRSAPRCSFPAPAQIEARECVHVLQPRLAGGLVRAGVKEDRRGEPPARERPASLAMRQRALAPAQESPTRSGRAASFAAGLPPARHAGEVGERPPREPPTDQ